MSCPRLASKTIHRFYLFTILYGAGKSRVCTSEGEGHFATRVAALRGVCAHAALAMAAWRQPTAKHTEPQTRATNYCKQSVGRRPPARGPARLKLGHGKFKAAPPGPPAPFNALHPPLANYSHIPTIHNLFIYNQQIIV